MSADCTALARSGAELLAKGGDEIGDRDTDLRHGIAFPDRHGLILERLEVHRDAERRPDLVLAAIAAADRLRLVVSGHEVREWSPSNSFHPNGKANWMSVAAAA